jgi:hypothetical protein
MKILRLPGIRSVDYCLAGEAKIDHQGLYNGQDKVRLINDVKTVPITGPVRMEITEDSKTGEILYTVKLLFDMPVSKGSENIKRAIMSASCCFIAEDRMRVRRLIGMKEKSHPAVAVSRLNEEKPGGKVLYALEITSVSNLPPFETGK